MTIEKAQADEAVLSEWQQLNTKVVNFEEIKWAHINPLYRLLSGYGLEYRRQGEVDGEEETPAHYATWFVRKVKADLHL